MLLYEGRPGKGGHGRIYLGDRFTTVPALTHEIPPGLLAKIRRDLGLTRRDLS
jgi:predicted RNA binding protein YcfA (HicA-like mRNA interferase family)